MNSTSLSSLFRVLLPTLAAHISSGFSHLNESSLETSFGHTQRSVSWRILGPLQLTVSNNHCSAFGNLREGLV